MRILKYIFLLLLLVFIASSIFIATQKADYKVSRSQVVNVSKTIAFDYVSDFANWPQWIIFEEGKIEYVFPTYSDNKTSSFRWDGAKTSGSALTLLKSGTDSITQKMTYDGINSELKWYFKDTVGGTKITVVSAGKMDFMSKFRSIRNGKVDKFVGSFYENSLANLDKSLKHELKTFKVEVEGIVMKTGKFYIQQTILSKDSNITNNSRIMRAKLEGFVKENSIAADGQPFILYHYSDAVNSTTKFSVCYPVKNEIFISEGSDISTGHFDSFRAVKTTLTGNYTHLPEAWLKTIQYLNTNKLTQKSSLPRLELYRISKEKASSPTQWVTELYLPIEDATTSIEPAQNTIYKPTTTPPAPNPTIAPASTVLPIKKVEAPIVKPKKPVVTPSVKEPKRETQQSTSEFD